MRLHHNEDMSLTDYENRVFGKAANWRTAAVKIDKELQICECLDVWTDVGGTVTASADATYFREGTTSAKLVLDTTLATGMVAYDTGSLADNDLSGGDYTHMAFEVRAKVAIAAGDFQIGLDDSATFNTAYGAGVRFVDVPAVPAFTTADPWYTVCVPLSGVAGVSGQLALTSVSSLGIWAIADQTGIENELYLDNFRLLRILPTGDEEITVPTIHSVGNTNGDTSRIDFLIFPFESSRLSSNAMPLAVELIPFRAAGTDAAQAGQWSSADAEQGHIELDAGDYLDDAPRSYTALAIKRATELTGVQKLCLEVVE